MMLMRPKWIESLRNSAGTREPGNTPVPVSSPPKSDSQVVAEAGHGVHPTLGPARITMAEQDVAIRAITAP